MHIVVFVLFLPLQNRGGVSFMLARLSEGSLPLQGILHTFLLMSDNTDSLIIPGLSNPIYSYIVT